MIFFNLSQITTLIKKPLWKSEYFIEGQTQTSVAKLKQIRFANTANNFFFDRLQTNPHLIHVHDFVNIVIYLLLWYFLYSKIGPLFHFDFKALNGLTHLIHSFLSHSLWYSSIQMGLDLYTEKTYFI